MARLETKGEKAEFELQCAKQTCDLYAILKKFQELSKPVEYPDTQLAFLAEKPQLLQRTKEYMKWDWVSFFLISLLSGFSSAELTLLI